MAKTKDKTAPDSSKKRKAQAEEVAESSTKKARREEPTAFVHLPHSPGGSLQQNGAPANVTTQPQSNDSDVELAEEPADEHTAPARKLTRKQQYRVNLKLRKAGLLPRAVIEAQELEEQKKAAEAEQAANAQNGVGDDTAAVVEKAPVPEGEGKSRTAKRRRKRHQYALEHAEEVTEAGAENDADQPGESTGKKHKKRTKSGAQARKATRERAAEAVRALSVDAGSDMDVPSSPPVQQSLESNDVAESDEALRKRKRVEEAKKAREAEKKAQKAEKKQAAGSSLALLTPSDEKKSKQPATGGVAMFDTGVDVKQAGWSLSTSTAGRFIDHDPIFVRDPETNEECLIAANARDVQLLSIETSLLVRSCPAPDGLTIQCFAKDPMDDRSIRIAYSDGSIAGWLWTTGKSEKIADHADGKPTCMEWAKTSTPAEDERGGVFYVSRTGKQSTIMWHGQSLYSRKQQLVSLQVLGESEYIVAHSISTLVLGAKQGVKQDKKNKKRGGSDFVWIELPFGQGITCVAAKLGSATPTDRRDTKRRSILSLAVGNNEGQIHLYNDVTSVFAQNGQASLPSPRILHWHREAVPTVKFSPDGNYLISGGKETVLVIWQLETGKKQFLPHLTSEIERVVVNERGDEYAVLLGDNSLMVLSTSELKPIANFAGLQLAMTINEGALKQTVHEANGERKGVAAILHPSDANQLLLTVPATQPKSHTEAAEARCFLQTFDLRTSRHITRQALTRNNVTDFNLGPEKTPIAPPDDAHLAISPDGQWLASVDEWEPPASDLQHLELEEEGQLDEERIKRREVFLKLWRWDEAQGLWTLSTRIDAPHARAASTHGVQGAGRVFKLVTDPASNGFATIGEDGVVKIWKSRARVRHGEVMKGDTGMELVEWTCRRTVELPAPSQRADSPLETAVAPAGLIGACLAYAEDGSVLAACQNFANTDEQPLVHLINGLSGEINIMKSGFGTQSPPDALGLMDRYFIAVAEKTAHVWDLVTDTLTQRYKLSSKRAEKPILSISHYDGTFAIATGARLSIYRPTETKAIYKTKFGTTIATMLAGKGSKGYTLLFEDATVRTLSSTGGAAHRLAALPAPAEPISPVTTTLPAIEGAAPASVDEDVEMSDILTRPSTAAGDVDVYAAPRLKETEDDRPVVRPEQLAQIFDVGQSFAMPPVKDMFEAVVEMFGRRPHAPIVEAVA